MPRKKTTPRWPTGMPPPTNPGEKIIYVAPPVSDEPTQDERVGEVRKSTDQKQWDTRSTKKVKRLP